MNCYAIDCPEEMVGLRVYFLYGGAGLLKSFSCRLGLGYILGCEVSVHGVCAFLSCFLHVRERVSRAMRGNDVR